MYCAHTRVAHHVHERVACPSWGAPPRILKTWVMELVERSNERRPNSACPREDQSSPRSRRTYCLPDGLSSLGPKEERLDASGLLPASCGLQWLCLRSRGSPEKRTKSATSPVPTRGPKSGRNCYVTPAFSRVPGKGDKNEKWLHHPLCDHPSLYHEEAGHGRGWGCR